MADVDTIPSAEEVAARVPPEIEAYEIVDGQVLLTVGAGRSHQYAVMELGTGFNLWAREHGAEALGQPFDVPTTRTRLRQPDLLVVLAAHRDRIGETGMVGPPDLVVEVLSPSTRRVDLGDKRAEYAGLGVPEYWCLDPRSGETFVFAPPDGPPRVLGLGDVLTSPRLPGLELPIASLLPPPEG